MTIDMLLWNQTTRHLAQPTQAQRTDTVVGFSDRRARYAALMETKMQMVSGRTWLAFLFCLASCPLYGGCRRQRPPLDENVLSASWMLRSPGTLVVDRTGRSNSRIEAGPFHAWLPGGWTLLSTKLTAHPPAVSARFTIRVSTRGSHKAESHPESAALRLFAYVGPAEDIGGFERAFGDDAYVAKVYRHSGGPQAFFLRYKSPWALYRSVYRTDPRCMNCVDDGKARRRLESLLWLRGMFLSRVRYWWIGRRSKAALLVIPTPSPWRYLVKAVLFERNGDTRGFLTAESRTLSERQTVFAVAKLLSTAYFVGNGAALGGRISTGPTTVGVNRKTGR